MYRIGFSTDIHNLEVSDKPQKLGSILYKLGYKVIAYSDGDIILHAISESILGALGLGDLGEHFSDSNKDNKNIDSLEILNYSLNKMKLLSYEIANIDITLICELIYMKLIKGEIRDKLSLLLNSSNINIKATRYEKECNQIQCNCAILLKKII